MRRRHCHFLSHGSRADCERIPSINFIITESALFVTPSLPLHTLMFRALTKPISYPIALGRALNNALRHNRIISIFCIPTDIFNSIIVTVTYVRVTKSPAVVIAISGACFLTEPIALSHAIRNSSRYIHGSKSGELLKHCYALTDIFNGISVTAAYGRVTSIPTVVNS